MYWFLDGKKRSSLNFSESLSSGSYSSGRNIL